MVPWIESQTIELDLRMPLSRRYEKHESVMRESSIELLNSVRAEITSTVKYAKYLAYLVNLRTTGRFYREAHALARVGQVDWKELMLAAIAYEIVLSIFACSTTVLATEIGPVLARNMDFWPEQSLARASCRMISQRNGSNVLTIAGWPGALGVVTGLSQQGFAVALNAVESIEGICKTGYPVMLYIRKVLEDARDYNDAVAMLSGAKLAAGALLTVVGTTNDQRIVIERTPTRFKHRRAKSDEPLVVTNHYRSLDDSLDEVGNILTQTSCGRFESLVEYSRSIDKSKLSDESLLYALTDDRIQQEITAQHVIIRPAINHLSLYVPRRLLSPKKE